MWSLIPYLTSPSGSLLGHWERFWGVWSQREKQNLTTVCTKTGRTSGSCVQGRRGSICIPSELLALRIQRKRKGVLGTGQKHHLAAALGAGASLWLSPAVLPHSFKRETRVPANNRCDSNSKKGHPCICTEY